MDRVRVEVNVLVRVCLVMRPKLAGATRVARGRPGNVWQVRIRVRVGVSARINPNLNPKLNSSNFYTRLSGPLMAH